MATEADYTTQTERIAAEEQRNQKALAKARDLHGGDTHPGAAPFPTIITQFGTWAVTEFGVECLVSAYQIQWDSLTDKRFDLDFWLRNLSKKEWVNLQDFADALRHGRAIHHYLHREER